MPFQQLQRAQRKKKKKQMAAMCVWLCLPDCVWVSPCVCVCANGTLMLYSLGVRVLSRINVTRPKSQPHSDIQCDIYIRHSPNPTQLIPLPPYSPSTTPSWLRQLRPPFAARRVAIQNSSRSNKTQRATCLSDSPDRISDLWRAQGTPLPLPHPHSRNSNPMSHSHTYIRVLAAS